MINCRVCTRLHDPAENTPKYIRRGQRHARPSFAVDVCQWCWLDFERRHPSLTENEMNLFIAGEMHKLARRAARGESIIRCEAICWDTNKNGGVSSHRCEHFVKDGVSSKERLCGVHLRHKAIGRQIITTPPAQPRFYIAGRTAEEFLQKAKEVIPPEWGDRLVLLPQDPRALISRKEGEAGGGDG